MADLGPHTERLIWIIDCYFNQIEIWAGLPVTEEGWRELEAGLAKRIEDDGFIRREWAKSGDN